MKINGITIDAADWDSPEFAAVYELLRQRAAELGYCAPGASEEDVMKAVERTLAEDVPVPEPTEEECRLWYEGNRQKYRSGELVNARHILIQVTPGARVPDLRAFAEAMLREVRRNPDVFSERAKSSSNCPTGANGGHLGQLARGQCVPEFDQAIFDTKATGILPQLVKTRYGFHIVCIDQRIEGEQLPFEAVHKRIADELRQQTESQAMSQYVRILAGNAELEGVDLDAATSPLVQ